MYGEDVESALRFLFNAMSEKAELPFHGIPQMIYTDNGPIAKSRVFQQVMRYLKIELRTHLPAGSDGRRVTARSKGKVERPFRTVKEMHETLYHFNHYRAFKKTTAEKQADRIEELAARLSNSKAALSGHPQIAELIPERRIAAAAFADPHDPFQELHYPQCHRRQACHRRLPGNAAGKAFAGAVGAGSDHRERNARQRRRFWTR